MDILNLLKILLVEQEQIFARTQNSFERHAQFSEIPNKIKVAIGMRRVGKTFFLLQEMKRLLQDKNVAWERCLYLNFEDDRLLPCSQEKLRLLLEAFYQIYPENHHETCYLFLDEVQNIENWSLVIRRFFDTKKVKIYLSGSSAKLLSKEIATELRGRSIATEIWPLSFQEYLNAKKIHLSGRLLGQQHYDLLFKHLQNYILAGGFPETIPLSQVESRQILQDYVELVILRDIVERHKIQNITIIKYLIQTLLKNAGCGFSINKFYNDLKSQGITSSRGLLYQYLDYLEDAYLIFPTPLFSESLRKTQSNPKKIYAIDPGLVKAYTLSLNENYGHLFENIVFLDFKRQGYKIHYYLTKDHLEVDFLIEDNSGKKKLYQVAWNTFDAKTLAREQRALDQAMQELNLEGELITPKNYIERSYSALTT
jgi:predicted AAA+ superfamily ATPase